MKLGCLSAPVVYSCFYSNDVIRKLAGPEQTVAGFLNLRDSLIGFYTFL